MSLAQQWKTYSTDTFELMSCGECGIAFYVPHGFYVDRREDGKGWYCPNGHPRVFKEREADKLRRELKRTEERAAERLEWLHEERERHAHTGRRLAATKAVVTKTKARIAAGKCVRCSCEFPDLAAHMAEAHPGYAPE